MVLWDNENHLLVSNESKEETKKVKEQPKPKNEKLENVKSVATTLNFVNENIKEIITIEDDVKLDNNSYNNNNISNQSVSSKVRIQYKRAEKMDEVEKSKYVQLTSTMDIEDLIQDLKDEHLVR